MTKKISLNEKIFVAGGNGMAGSAICRMLKKAGYGNNIEGGSILTPSRKELNLLVLLMLVVQMKMENKLSIFLN